MSSHVPSVGSTLQQSLTISHDPCPAGTGAAMNGSMTLHPSVLVPEFSQASVRSPRPSRVAKRVHVRVCTSFTRAALCTTAGAHFFGAQSLDAPGYFPQKLSGGGLRLLVSRETQDAASSLPKENSPLREHSNEAAARFGRAKHLLWRPLQ